MSTSLLHEVYRAIVIGKLCYTWWGFTSADGRQHLDGFIWRSVRQGYCASDLDIVSIIDQADGKLFQLVLTYPNHFYHHCSLIKQINTTISRYVRILSFCTSRILRRVGQCAQNWPSCTELTKQHRYCKILHILFSNIALSAVLTAATASTKHFDVKLIKLFCALMLQLQGVSISNCENFKLYAFGNLFVSWHQKRQCILRWPSLENNTKKI